MSKQKILQENETLNNQTESSSQKQQENKQENKRAGGKFIVIMLISMLVGGFIGGFSMAFLNHYEGTDLTALVGGTVTHYIGAASPFMLVLLTAAGFLYSSVVYLKCRRRWDKYGNVEDDLYEKTEETLNGALIVPSVVTIINYFLFSAAFYYFMYDKKTIWFLVGIIAFVENLVLIMLHQQKVVDFVKLMNPEKQGSIYDMKFQKKWLDSCDEAEKLQIYQCGHKAYQTASNFCVTLWVFFTLLAIVFKISLWPSGVAVLIWLVLTVTYSVEASKMNKLNQ